MSPITGSPAEDTGSVGYTTAADVHSHNTGRQMFTATSRDVTLSDVNRFIIETAAVIDGILTERSYVAPVPTTATVAYGLLSHFNALGAACMVEKAAPTSDRREEACKAWENAQQMLKTGAVQLTDAEISGTNDMPRGVSAPTAMFTRDMDF